MWAVWRRIRDLSRFRSGLQKYFGAVRYEAFPYRVVETPAAAEARADVEGQLTRCRRIVTVGGVPSAVRLVAAEEAGEVHRVNLISVAFELDRHNLRREDLLAVLDAATVHHRSMMRGAWLRTVNPFYWLDMTLSVAEIIPFLPLRWLGRDPGRAANSRPGSAVRALLRLVTLALLLWLGLRVFGLDDDARTTGERTFREIWYLWGRRTGS